MLQLDPGMMIWTWITFLVLLAVLLKIAWKPILSMVNQREKTINESIEKAEEARNQAEQMMEEQQKKLNSAQDEIRRMLKENKELAEKTRNEIIENAKAEAEKLQQRAHADIERERQAAVQELRKQVADLAIMAASQLIKENLDAQKHRELIDDYITELDRLNKN